MKKTNKHMDEIGRHDKGIRQQSEDYVYISSKAVLQIRIQDSFCNPHTDPGKKKHIC